MFLHGQFPKNNACHTCDVRLCVNPLHIFDGSQVENMRDMVAKGRHGTATTPGLQAGERNANSKISDADVEQIRSLYATGQYKQRELAQQFGVNQNHISRIIRKEARK
jgi:predicted XRE-type DNA-binding protein